MKNDTKPLKYKIGVYVRESRDDNEENYDTIETQRDLLLDYINKNNWGEVVRIYIDDNVSGSAFDRNGITLLTSDVKEHIIDLLVLKDLSRLGRNNAKTLMFLDFLEEAAVRVITFDGRYDSIRDNDTVGIDTWYNERYVRDISKKIRANLRFKIEKGEYIGHAPYGYVKSAHEKNKLCIDYNSSEIVKYIFKLYLQGYGYSYISKTLNNERVPTPSMRNTTKKCGFFWNAVAVKRILLNRVYIGDTVQGISEKVSFKSKKTRRLPSEKWVITENTHEGIISKVDFEEANKIHEGKESGKGQHKGTIHLFKGIVFCGNCNSIMYARQRTGKPMAYICSSLYKMGKTQCSSHYIREDVLIDIINEELTQLLSREESSKYISEFFELNENNENESKQEISKIEKVLLSKQKQQEVIYMDKLEGRISEQLFIRTNKNIEARVLQLRHDIEKIRSRGSGKSKKQILSDFVYDIKEFDITYEIIKYLVDKIIVLDEQDNFSLYELSQEDEALINHKASIIIYFKF